MPSDRFSLIRKRIGLRDDQGGSQKLQRAPLAVSLAAPAGDAMKVLKSVCSSGLCT